MPNRGRKDEDASDAGLSTESSPARSSNPVPDIIVDPNDRGGIKKTEKSERKPARNSDSNPSRSRNTGIKTTNKLAIAFGIIVAISILSITLVYALLQIGGGSASLDAKIHGVSVVLGGAFAAFVALYYVLFRSFKVLLSLIPVVVALIICAGTLVAVTPDTGQPYASKNDEEITALRAEIGGMQETIDKLSKDLAESRQTLAANQDRLSKDLADSRQTLAANQSELSALRQIAESTNRRVLDNLANNQAAGQKDNAASAALKTSFDNAVRIIDQTQDWHVARPAFFDVLDASNNGYAPATIWIADFFNPFNPVGENIWHGNINDVEPELLANASVKSAYFYGLAASKTDATSARAEVELLKQKGKSNPQEIDAAYTAGVENRAPPFNLGQR